MFNLKKLFFFLSVLLVIHPFLFAEEQLTIVTYYPSPAGSYYNLYVANALGIGTTNPVAADSSAKTLQIGNEYILQNVIGNQVLLSNNAYYDGTWKRAIADYATAIRMYNGEIDFHLAPSGAAGSAIGSNWDGSYRAMTILNTGNVGIGTTVPRDKLDVQSTATVLDVWFGNSLQTNYTDLILYSDTGTAQIWKTGSGYSGYGGVRSLNIYNSEDYPIAFFQGSSERMRINSGGNVGIGTTGPGAKLDILGPTITGSPWTAEVIRFASSSYPAQYGSLWIDESGASGGMALGVAGARSLYIAQTTGNVGIGTTGPAAKLDIAGSNIRITGSYPYLWFRDMTYWNQDAYIQTGVTTGGSGNGNFMWFYVPSSRGFAFQQGSSNPLTIDTTGYVGIGTTTPGAKLSFNNLNDGTNGADGITWYNPTPLSYGIYRSAGAWASPNYQQLTLSWATGIVIDGGSGYGRSGTVLQPNGGNVGIGTTSPSDKLTVAGNEVPSTDAVFTSGKSGQRWSAVWASNGTIQTCFLAYKNITSWKPFSDYLYLVPRPVQYTWKSGDNREHLGYIGDDLPAIAKVDKDGIEEKAVIAILCGAVRQLEEKVKGLEAEISGLKGKL